MFISRKPGMRFVDRGDPLPSDSPVGGFVPDSSWRDWDISAIVGVGRRLVLIRVWTSGGGAVGIVQFQTKGNVNDSNVSAVFTPVAGVEHHDKWVWTDATGTIQYYISGPANAPNAVTIIGGWFK